MPSPVPKVYQFAFALLLPLLLSACDSVSEKPADKMKEAAAALSFVQEPRTGLCFAMLASQTYAGYLVTAITAVPCSEAVLRAAGDR